MGIQLGLNYWTDNGKANELVYNADKGLTAFVKVHLPSFLPSPFFHLKLTSSW